MSDNKNNMVNIGGLWLNKDKDGNFYFSGYLNGARLLAFKNNFKETSKHPHYIMYVTNSEPRSQAASADEFEQQAESAQDTPPVPPSDSDNIPF